MKKTKKLDNQIIEVESNSFFKMGVEDSALSYKSMEADEQIEDRFTPR